jgi:hypothetical protein
MRPKIYALAAIFSTVIISLAAAKVSEAATCVVEPFITEIPAGQSGKVGIIVSVDKLSSPLQISIGNLPGQVIGGFPNEESIFENGYERKVSILIKSEPNAQKGSFMIPVLYKTDQDLESICQFNLVITEALAASSTNSSSVELNTKVSNLNLIQRFIWWISELFKKNEN